MINIDVRVITATAKVKRVTGHFGYKNVWVDNSMGLCHLTALDTKETGNKLDSRGNLLQRIVIRIGR